MASLQGGQVVETDRSKAECAFGGNVRGRYVWNGFTGRCYLVLVREPGPASPDEGGR